MGKIKRRKLRGSRYMPTNSINKDIKALEDKFSTNGASVDDTVHNYNCTVPRDEHKGKSGLKLVNEKIMSKVSEERVTGLNILAAIVLDENSAEFIIQSNIIASVASLLQDSNTQVRLAAAGTLRNLCLSGSDEVVDLMVQQDILPPLAKLLKEYSTNNPPSDLVLSGASLTYSKGIANSMEETDPCNLIFIHATNLLWNLCECNEEAIRMCNQEGLATVLLKHINPSAWTYPVAMAAADCLLCISENNPRTSSIILPYADTLVSLVFQSLSTNNVPSSLHFAVIVSGILFNLNYWTPGGPSFCQLFEVLGRILNTDAVSLFNDHAMNPKTYGKTAFTEDLEHVIASQLLAFEILSNICCPDEDEEWEDNEETESEDDMFDVSKDAPIQNQIPSSVPLEVVEGIKYYQLVDKTIKKVTFPRNHLLMKDKNQDIVDKLTQLQIRALQCCQNLVSCLDIEDFGGADALYAIWLELGKKTFIDNCKDSNFLEASSGALRAFLDKLSREQHSHIVTITEEDLKHVFEAGISCTLSAVRSNLARMVGILGCLLIQRTNVEDICVEPTISILSKITEFLLKVAKEDEALWVSAEALDVIIDLYSDDKTDQLSSHLCIVEKLKEIHPQFKAKHNRLRKRLGDHRPLVVTVRDNLVAFIKYKGPRTAKLSQQLNRMAL